MTTSYRSPRLDVRDLPKDQKRVIIAVRQALVAAFNYCRSKPSNLEFLRVTVGFVYKRIIAAQKQREQWDTEQEQAAKLAERLRKKTSAEAVALATKTPE